MRISQKANSVIIRNLRHIIFMWRRRYWQIFISALVYNHCKIKLSKKFTQREKLHWIMFSWCLTNVTNITLDKHLLVGTCMLFLWNSWKCCCVLFNTKSGTNKKNNGLVFVAEHRNWIGQHVFLGIFKQQFLGKPSIDCCTSPVSFPIILQIHTELLLPVKLLLLCNIFCVIPVNNKS